MLSGVCRDLYITCQLVSCCYRGALSRRADHEYTSSIGGNTFFPPSVSFFRNLFRLRNSDVVTSSLRWASQDSCKVSISSFSSSFCSSESLATHATLSNFGAAVVPSFPSPVPPAFLLPRAGLGWPKNDVMLRVSRSVFGKELS